MGWFLSVQGMSGVLFLGVQAYARPYRLPLDNSAELLAQISLLILCIFLESASVPISTPRAIGLTAMCMFVSALFVARIVIDRWASLAQLLGINTKALHRGDGSSSSYMNGGKSSHSRQATAQRLSVASNASVSVNSNAPSKGEEMGFSSAQSEVLSLRLLDAQFGPADHKSDHQFEPDPASAGNSSGTDTASLASAELVPLHS